MFAILSDFFQKKGIFTVSAIDLSDCTVLRGYLLERAGICNGGTAVIFAVPYFTEACLDPLRNLSAYAVGKDYHHYFSALFEELIPLLRRQYPNHRFAGFSDHSPIAEVEAAARAGLGMIGENGLLITERHSSYVFLGELITDARFGAPAQEIRRCMGCGQCKKACPSPCECLSALTQKKGALTDEEQSLLKKHGSVWGCDACQEACPFTKRAIERGTIFTPIPYFREHVLPTLTSEQLHRLSDEELATRAYFWRGRPTIERNLKLTEEEPKC